MVGIENEGIYKAYKLQDIEKLKVINDKLDNKSLTLFSLYPIMARAFDTRVNNQTLTFYFNSTDNSFRDKQTQSEWDFEGKSIESPLRGKALLRLPFDEGYWFEWVAFHPETKVY